MCLSAASLPVFPKGTTSSILADTAGFVTFPRSEAWDSHKGFLTGHEDSHGACPVISPSGLNSLDCCSPS